ncbi:MAG: glycosyltransferase family 9 protein [bacterium]
MTEKTGKILIVNMTRMGDIIQTTPLLQALQAKHPDHELCYFAVSGFTEICDLIPEIDRVIPFDFNAAIAISKEAVRLLPRRLQELDCYLVELHQENFTSLYNLSHSRHSALLSYLLNVPNIHGLTLDAEGFRRIEHPWSKYFFIGNLNRHYNRINLVDVNLGMSLDVDDEIRQPHDSSHPFGKYRLSFTVKPEAVQQADKLFAAWEQNQSRFKIGIQPGASLDCKRWPTESFASLAQNLVEKLDAGIVVFGTKSEAGLAEEVSAPLGNHALNLAGKTDVASLGAALQKLDLLITNDTGTQHVAAAVGTPVLSLCFGSALSHETGPYAKDHFVVEADLSCYPCSFHVKCSDFRCQQAVTPDIIYRTAAWMLNESADNPQHWAQDTAYHDVNIWRTDFDADGFWLLRPVLQPSLKPEDLIALCSRMLWKQVLTNPQSLPENGLDYEALKVILEDYAPPEEATFRPGIEEAETALQQLSELAFDGQLNCKVLEMAAEDATIDPQQLKGAGEELFRIDESITQMGFRLPAVNQLVLDFVFNKQNLIGDEMGELSRATHRIYKRLQNLSLALISALSSLSPLLPLKSEVEIQDFEPVREVI